MHAQSVKDSGLLYPPQLYTSPNLSESESEFEEDAEIIRHLPHRASHSNLQCRLQVDILRKGLKLQGVRWKEEDRGGKPEEEQVEWKVKGQQQEGRNKEGVMQSWMGGKV